MLIAILPLALVNFAIRPGKYALTMKLALEPGPFIPAALLIEPGAFPMRHSVFQLAGIFTHISTGHFKENGKLLFDRRIRTATGNQVK